MFSNSLDSISAKQKQAIDGFRNGQFDQAESICREIIDQNASPQALAEAWDLLGLVEHRRGRFNEAVDRFERAVQLVPNNAELHSHLAEACRIAGRVDNAIDCARNAVRLNEELASAHNNLGLAMQDKEELELAASSFRRAIELQPSYAKAHYNLANVLRQQESFEEAESRVRKALARQPKYLKALNLLGVLLMDLRRLDEAIACLQGAHRESPNDPSSLLNLGNALAARGDIQEAIESYERALAKRPNYEEALLGLGRAFEQLRQLDKAISYLRRAVDIQPDSAAAHFNLANVFLARNERALAKESYQRALEIDSTLVEAAVNLETCRLNDCFWDDFETRMTSLHRIIAKRLDANKPSPVTASQRSMFPLSAEEELAIARRVSNDLVESTATVRKQLNFSFSKQRRPRLRIGYLSADFRHHAVGHLTRSLYALHDRRRFEVFAYSFGPDDGSEYRRDIVGGCDQFVDVAKWPDADVARRIHQDGIDILIDLMGYTGNARSSIVALRPAPIQVNYLGCPATMGAQFIDYYVTDRVATLESMVNDFDEALVFMPNCYQVNDHHQPIADKTFTRDELGLPQNGFVYCCFNRSYKIQPSIFDVWMRILSAVSGSVLWLMDDGHAMVENLRREATQRGVEPERLVFAGKLPKDEHLARHRMADLFLDTTVCNAHTTASDSLWSGLPLLTCTGRRFTERVAASLLSAVGLPELIAEDVKQYEEVAIHLATNPAKLRNLRTRLSQNRDTCALFDTPRYVRDLETAFERMWERFLAGKQPANIALDQSQPS